MATRTETVDIRFRGTGIRTIKRKIDALGQSANNATRGIFLMQRALFVLGGAGLLRGLVRQIDQLTNYENRLKLTTTSAANLDAVQKRLFETARQSRSSFESVAEIYTRTALSVKDLGVSQEQTIQFTESLAKATIISGASAREANAAMVQLGQGMASNTLRGDELRSVLEQLPFVADVIAEHFGVTRGELRRLGEEGKISAKDILDAFADAEEKIDKLFAQTSPTIEQALVVANVNWLEFLDRADDATGASAGFARAIIVVSKNVDVLAVSLLSLAAAWTLSFSIKTVQRIANFAAGLKEGAIRSLGLLEVERKRANFSKIRTAFTEADTAANVRNLKVRRAWFVENVRLLKIEKEAAAFTVVNGRARNTLTGQFISLTAAAERLSAANVHLAATETALLGTSRNLTAAKTAQIAATNAAAVSSKRLTVATVASGSVLARFTARFPLLAGGLNLVKRGLTSVWGLLARNPIGAAVVAVGLLVAALVKWGNVIKITEDNVVGLSDFIVAAFELTSEAIQPHLDSISKQWNELVEKLKEPWNDFKQFMKDTIVDLIKLWFNFTFFIPRLMTGAVFAVIEVLKILPKNSQVILDALLNAFIEMWENIHNAAVEGINKIIGGINDLIKFFGADKAAEFFGFSGEIPELPEIKLPRIPNEEAESLGRKIGEALEKGFKEGWDATSFENTLKAILKLIEPILKRAREIAERGDPTLNPGKGGKGGGVDPDFQKIIDRMNEQVRLLGLENEERRIGQGLIKIEKELKRDLTAQEERLATTVIRRLIHAKEERKILDGIRAPQETYIRNLATINRLLAKGRISIEEYNDALKDNRIEFLDTQTGAMAGFERGLLKVEETALDVGKGIEGAVVNAFEGATDAFVEFVETGKLSFKDLINSIIADLTRLAFQRSVVAALSGALTNLFGPPTVDTTTLVGPNGHDGGSIMPSGPGSTDSQQVFFNKRPDERVDILTPAQQQQQQDRENKRGRGSVALSQTFNISNAIDPDSFRRSQPQMASRGLREVERINNRLGK